MDTRIVITLLVATLSCATARAGNVQSHDSIRQAAEEYISSAVTASHGKSPDVRASGLDSRLRLSECELPLETFLPTGGKLLGNTTVGVRCTGTKPWTLYVPVKSSLFGQVVVAAQPLTRNHVMQAEDMKLEDRDLAQLHSGYFTDSEKLIGMKVTRTVALNATLNPALVKEPLAVKRGQRVSLVANTSGIEVSMVGEAMADGVTGERIQVRNLSSKRVLDGIVRSANVIQVSM